MIVVPYTTLSEETRLSVPKARFVPVEPVYGYRRLLAELWEAGETFTLVEHDAAPTKAQIDAFDACPHAWCFYGYYPGHWVPVFGCTRFRDTLIAGTQGVWDDDSWPWNQLDARFATFAQNRGFTAHWHYPHVEHDGHFNYPGGSVKASLGRDIQMTLLEVERDALRRLTGD